MALKSLMHEQTNTNMHARTHADRQTPSQPPIIHQPSIHPTRRYHPTHPASVQQLPPCTAAFAMANLSACPQCDHAQKAMHEWTHLTIEMPRSRMLRPSAFFSGKGHGTLCARLNMGSALITQEYLVLLQLSNSSCVLGVRVQFTNSVSVLFFVLPKSSRGLVRVPELGALCSEGMLFKMGAVPKACCSRWVGAAVLLLVLF